MHSCTCSEHVELYEGVPELVTNKKLYTPVTPTMMDALQQQAAALKKSKSHPNILYILVVHSLYSALNFINSLLV